MLKKIFFLLVKFFFYFIKITNHLLLINCGLHAFKFKKGDLEKLI